MKWHYNLLTAFAIIVTLSSAQCNKNKEPLEQLPAETQTGAGTFGCLVNGEVFKPKGSGLTNILSCNYQYIYNSPTGFVFALKATRNGSNCELTSISIGGDSIRIGEGNRYPLGEFNKSQFAAAVSSTPGCTFPLIISKTSVKNIGELYIKKLDEANQIASGTFWFTVVKDNGDTVRVTDGRFDVKYTR